MTKLEEAMFKAKGDLGRAQDKFLEASLAVLKEKAETKVAWLTEECGVIDPRMMMTTNLEHLAKMAFNLGKQVGK